MNRDIQFKNSFKKSNISTHSVESIWLTLHDANNTQKLIEIPNCIQQTIQNQNTAFQSETAL